MLTILLTLRNRAEFTPRFLKHTCRWDWPVLIADGSDTPQVAGSWGAAYKYFGPDLTTARYHTKVYSALEMVYTPYVMLADNDDLPTPYLQRCINFLEYNLAYVCCSGRIQGFHMWPHPVTGPHSAVTRQYSPYDTPADYSQETVSDRVLAGFANSWSYYAVYRTEALRSIWQSVCALNLTNFQVHEKFCAMYALRLGHAHCSPHWTSLYRQHGTSQGIAWDPQPGIDLLKVLTVMEAEGVDRLALEQRWAKWYAKRDRYFHNPWRKVLKRSFPNLAWYVQNRHRYLPHTSLTEKPK